MNRKIITEIVFLAVRIAVIAAIVYAGIRLVPTFYDFGFRIFADEARDPAPGITKTVAIVDGKSDKEIGDILKDKGLIDNSLLFMLQVKFSIYDGLLQPGVYELSTAMSPYEMMEAMAATEEGESSDNDEEPSVSTKDAATLWDEADDTVKPQKQEDGK